MRTSVLTAILLLLSPLSASLWGRLLPDWSFDKLMKVSDIVVIVEPLSNTNNSDQWEWSPKFAQGVTTTFKVWCYLKGGAGPDTIQVKHFVYKGGWPPNGGIMINFLPGPLDIDATYTIKGRSEPFKFGQLQVRWLAFLKKGLDGSFVPTSGQIDPSLSFQELHDVSMFDPTHGMIPSK
jgi:hypothetical protein